ncbi:MAG: ABC transporter substrate-binding protein [Candidatus Sumerlaeia bacterium]|nr:ABC transporter substrate-binding protein [Candidatus Sumerlaeia bacterium]
MWTVLNRLGLGLVLIALAGSVLLWADWDRRGDRRRGGGVDASGERHYRVALFQLATRPIMDDLAFGGIRGLRESGIVDGRNATFVRYNAEGDLATATAIGQAIVEKDYDLVITYSTQCLQAVAAANRGGRVNHVFAGVVDPFETGVGLNRDDLYDHPDHLVGIGTMVPVREAIELALRMNPNMGSLGIVWNPAEKNSELCTYLARSVCAELGITLMEAQVDNTAGVLEAAQSLVSRGVDALYLGGDNTVDLGFNSLKRAADQTGIPVFTYSQVHGEMGALFGMGAYYFQVGVRSGKMAAEVLKGRDIRDMPIVLEVPVSLSLNLSALDNLRDNWAVPDDVIAAANILIDESGDKIRDETEGAESVEDIVEGLPGASISNARVAIVYYGPDPSTEASIEGFRDGLRELGLVQGENLELIIRHAQGETSTIPQIMQQVDNMDVDLVVPMTTPCLVGALANVRNAPIVFTSVYDPIAAGAGTSYTDHRPNVTGVGSLPPIEETMDLIRELVPTAERVGTLYNPSEANSERAARRAKAHLGKDGYELVEVPIVTSSDVHQAVASLVSRGVDAIWITGDNTAIQAYSAIVRGARDANLALVNNDVEMLEQGSLASVGIGFYEAGRAAAPMAVRVLSGESPAGIPMENVAVINLGLNYETARLLGYQFPEEVVRRANVFHGLADSLEGPIPMYISGEISAGDRDGIEAALGVIGLRRDREYVLSEGRDGRFLILLDEEVADQPTYRKFRFTEGPGESRADLIQRAALEAARIIALEAR